MCPKSSRDHRFLHAELHTGWTSFGQRDGRTLELDVRNYTLGFVKAGLIGCVFPQSGHRHLHGYVCHSLLLRLQIPTLVRRLLLL